MLRPLKDKILVKRLDAETMTKSGIIIPDTVIKKNTHAMVVAVGEGKISDKGIRIPIDLIPGDYVVFEDHSGWPVQVNGVEHQVIREEQVVLSNRPTGVYDEEVGQWK